MKSLLKYRLLFVLVAILLSAECALAQADCATSNMNANCSSKNLNVANTPIVRTASTLASPQVTYVGGQLTIAAENVSLRDVLRAVSLRTGAVVEFPVARAEERIFTKLGPGPIKAVLTNFLNGSHFNYVMLGDPGNPNSLERLILTDSDEPNPTAPAVSIAHQEAPPEAAPKAPSPYSPPAQAAFLPPIVIPDIQAPKEPLSSEALGAMMKELAHQQREKQQQQDSEISPTLQ